MLDTIESAIEDIKQGKLVIVVDDEDRENEGDFITAARNITPEVVNFMAKYGRGLICISLLEERCNEMGLELMVNNTRPCTKRPLPYRLTCWATVALPAYRHTTVLKPYKRSLIPKQNQKNWASPAIFSR